MKSEQSHSGWARYVVGNVADDVCWYGSTPCKSGYVMPKSHRILLTAPSLSGQCSWQVGENTVYSKPQPCDEDFMADLPYRAGATVNVRQSTTSAVTTLPIKITDLFVVGIGDSFASGEGNPDMPLVFSDYGNALSYGNSLAGYPQRRGLKTSDYAQIDSDEFNAHAARWSHRTCHRSLYSHQLRAAMQLAIEDPKQQTAVTFLSLACTGSEIGNGLFNAYGGATAEPNAENDPPSSTHKVSGSQLSGISRANCAEKQLTLGPENYNEAGVINGDNDNKIQLYKCDQAKRLRSIDALLISIGGNDVGFSGLVANSALKDEYLGLAKLFGRNPKITPLEAQDIANKELAGKYKTLALALAQTLGVEANRVFLTAYPQAGFSGKGKACETTRQGFDVTAQWQLDGKRAAEAEAFISETLTPIMRKAAADHQWQFVDAYRTSKIFEDHGVCAKGPAEESEKPALNDKFPRQGTIDGKTQFDPYDPNQFAPYLQRQRWFRTPNDAFLTVHLHGTEFIPDMALKLTSWTAYGGALHPTAEGQAVMADALYKELSKRMKGAK